MVTYAEMAVQNYAVIVPEPTLDSTKINMADEGLDMAIGFAAPDLTFKIPSPDIATIQVLTRSVTNYVLDEESIELELEQCSQNSY